MNPIAADDLAFFDPLADHASPSPSSISASSELLTIGSSVNTESNSHSDCIYHCEIEGNNRYNNINNNINSNRREKFRINSPIKLDQFPKIGQNTTNDKLNLNISDSNCRTFDGIVCNLSPLSADELTQMKPTRSISFNVVKTQKGSGKKVASCLRSYHSGRFSITLSSHSEQYSSDTDDSDKIFDNRIKNETKLLNIYRDDNNKKDEENQDKNSSKGRYDVYNYDNDDDICGNFNVNTIGCENDGFGGSGGFTATNLYSSNINDLKIEREIQKGAEKMKSFDELIDIF